MFPPFPQELAHFYCMSLIKRLETGDASIVQVGRESEERKNQGNMIGALVCQNKDLKRVVLYALSGNGKKLELNYPKTNLSEIVVPSLVSSDEISKALSEYDLEIHQLTDKINSLETSKVKEDLLKKRRKLTDINLQRVFNLYSFTRFDKKKITLNEIILKHGNKLPPTGTGDCSGPKLLCYAFEHDLMPVSMDEVYYGSNTSNKINGCSYDPCDDRCGYILPYILGIEILYRDNNIIVVNKESGLLSVPGKGPMNEDSVETRVRKLFPHCIKQPAVHRLDMETSGILILAFNKQAHSNLNKQFAQGIIKKKYVALLDGILYGNPQGKIELKTRLDVDHRPFQIVDNKNGKMGITLWQKLGVRKIYIPEIDQERKVTLIEFQPLTGRTHQLRLAASVPKELGGLGIPILGDSLYGKNDIFTRLMLHAFYVEFFHPISGEKITIEKPIKF